MDKKYGRRASDKDTIDKFKSCPNYFGCTTNNGSIESVINEVHNVRERLDKGADKMNQLHKDLEDNKRYNTKWTRYIFGVGVISMLINLFRS